MASKSIPVALAPLVVGVAISALYFLANRHPPKPESLKILAGELKSASTLSNESAGDTTKSKRPRSRVALGLKMQTRRWNYLAALLVFLFLASALVVLALSLISRWRRRLARHRLQLWAIGLLVVLIAGAALLRAGELKTGATETLYELSKCAVSVPMPDTRPLALTAMLGFVTVLGIGTIASLACVPLSTRRRRRTALSRLTHLSAAVLSAGVLVLACARSWVSAPLGHVISESERLALGEFLSRGTLFVGTVYALGILGMLWTAAAVVGHPRRAVSSKPPSVAGSPSSVIPRPPTPTRFLDFIKKRTVSDSLVAIAPLLTALVSEFVGA